MPIQHLDQIGIELGDGLDGSDQVDPGIGDTAMLLWKLGHDKPRVARICHRFTQPEHQPRGEKHDEIITHAVIKTIAAFLNSDGGTLLIGVTDAGETCGVEHDQFDSTDKFLLFLTDKLKTDTAFAARFYRAVATLLADRLRTTVSHLGYGSSTEQADPDELDEALMDSVSMGAVRFDRLLKHLRIN